MLNMVKNRILSKSLMEPLPSWKSFAFELVLYAILLVAYFAFVLHYLGGWFKVLYDHDRTLFAVMALIVMITQTVGLQIVCSFLIWLLGASKNKKKK